MAKSIFSTRCENKKPVKQHLRKSFKEESCEPGDYARPSPLEKILSRPVQKHSIGQLELVDMYKGLQQFIQQISSHLNQGDLENILTQLSGRRPEALNQPSKLVQRPTKAD